MENSKKIVLNENGNTREVDDKTLHEIQSDPSKMVVFVEETNDKKVFKVLNQLLG